MKKLSGLVVAIMLGLIVSAQTDPDFVPLNELFKNDFLAGVAVNGRSITGDAGKMVISNFNTLTCENEMKPQSLLYFPFGVLSEGPRARMHSRDQPTRHREASRTSLLRANRHLRLLPGREIPVA